MKISSSGPRLWNITTATCAYTNHTVLAEALETWPEDLLSRRLPRIYNILKEINRRFCEDLWQKYPGDWDKISRMSVLSHNTVRMANLCVMGSHCVNGVFRAAQQHHQGEHFSAISTTIRPEKFQNVTNGIAHRRWLNQANPELCALLNDTIGEGYAKNAEKLAEFKKFEKDESVLKRLGEIKRIKKQQLADRVKKVQGIDIDPDTLFDVQGKAPS